MIGDSDRTRPAIRVTVPRATSALYVSVHVAPKTMTRPATIQTEKSQVNVPTRASYTPAGSSHQPTRARPATVCATRSPTPRARAIGTSPTMAIETPSRKGVAVPAEAPASATRPPAATATAPRHQWAPRVGRVTGEGRLRMAVTTSRTLTRQADNATTTRVSTTPSP
jgi:hypothetical protein